MALSKAELPKGWLTKALQAPPRSYEEVIRGAYNPYKYRYEQRLAQESGGEKEA